MNSNLILFLLWNRIMNLHCDVFINQNHWSGKQYCLKNHLERVSWCSKLFQCHLEICVCSLLYIYMLGNVFKHSHVFTISIVSNCQLLGWFVNALWYSTLFLTQTIGGHLKYIFTLLHVHVHPVFLFLLHLISIGFFSIAVHHCQCKFTSAWTE